ncbi:hypothetical protein DRW03_14775 [Corallococcus sp. H22C18031201]|nr:hypothetical protein DRW03_14775 [Corallococcus sp. H22C18031201]
MAPACAGPEEDVMLWMLFWLDVSVWPAPARKGKAVVRKPRRRSSAKRKPATLPDSVAWLPDRMGPGEPSTVAPTPRRSAQASARRAG